MRKLTLPAAALAAVVLAVALAGPALAGSTVAGVASATSTAKKALKVANAAQSTANKALLAAGIGNYLGYADISGGPTVLTGQNVTQSNVISPTAGYFCFYNMPFTPNVATVTLDHPSTGNPNVNTNTYFGTARVVGDDPICPGPEQASVVTNNSAGQLANAEFQVVFF
jgi:type II secretory pathway pseudopilin PulG